MISKNTNQSQSTAQISVNTQPKSKATKQQSFQIEKNKWNKKLIKSLLQCKI